ncbi:MAG: RagB/SusD family nutrient uptake outer membrane protein [Paludibacteraceae bacterium]|nr:RagB/SusD family nutrient uptake outer membrane protein [Paludibacteraceae bacterium]
MKTSYKIFALCVLFASMMTSCKDFLNQPVYDDFTDEEFWNTEEQARAFFYGFYPSVFAGYGSGFSHGPFLMGQTLNDDVVSDKQQQDLTPLVVPVADGSWSFSSIRRANYALASVKRINASDAAIAHWQGVARFFRACFYSNLVFLYGDVPWYDRVPGTSEKDYLYKDREPRTYVDSLLLEDWQYAMDNIRATDGALQVNRFVAAGMCSRFLLREGTFLKYHGETQAEKAMAERCLKMAKDAALLVMNSGRYTIWPVYTELFTSEDLGANTECLISRHYEDGVLSHSTLTYSFTEAQAGVCKSIAEAFVCSDGLPVYVKDEFWVAHNAGEFFANRDPRLSFTIRHNDNKYYFKGLDNQPYNYALSGYSWRKFMDDNRSAKPEPTWTGSKNVTDAPCLRYAEVLLNYAEAAYELHLINPNTYAFTDEDLNKSINLIRARADVNLPALQLAGDKMSVNGRAFDDPVRLQIENNANGPITDAILWEIRRERRVELCLEGFRLNDLKRWGKLDYVWNGCNPDIRYGAYIVLDDYKDAAGKSTLDPEVVLEDPSATEGYVLRNTLGGRNRPTARNYVNPVPSGQITLYESKGYKLTQTKEWQ